jgi:ribose-phosphate pyrophosphokinase
LDIPYFPYAREDRVFSRGQPLGAAVMADLVNNLGYEEVCIVDPHSDVVPALLKNCTVIPQHEALRPVLDGFAKDSLFLIAPDAGAEKKVTKYEHPYIVARKVRDVETGLITGTHVDIPKELKAKTAVIVDDICDGGHTFTLLAEAIRQQCPAMHIVLAVTHGIFSRGFEIFEGLIDEIYTTNTLDDSFRGTVKIRRMK